MDLIIAQALKTRTLVKVVTTDYIVRFSASIVAIATAAALLEAETPTTAARLMSGAAQAVGVDVGEQVSTVTTWLAAHPDSTTAAYLLASVSALVLVSQRPWIDIAQTGTVCATRASAALVLFYAVAVEAGGGVRIAPTVVVVGVLIGGAIYVTREDRPFLSALDVVCVMLWEVFVAVMYVPGLALLVLSSALFGPLSAYEQEHSRSGHP